MNKEKRRYHRIVPQIRAFASTGGTLSGVCRLHDISMQGIGIGCISDIFSGSDDIELSLFLPEKHLEVNALPCRIIYQLSELKQSQNLKGEALFGRFRFGIAFEQIDKPHRKMLSSFIDALK